MRTRQAATSAFCALSHPVLPSISCQGEAISEHLESEKRAREALASSPLMLVLLADASTFEALEEAVTHHMSNHKMTFEAPADACDFASKQVRMGKHGIKFDIVTPCAFQQR